MTDSEAAQIEARIYDKKFFDYPLVDRAYKIVERCYKQPKNERMNNVLFYGESNSGKTELIKFIFKKLYNTHQRNDIVYIRAPSRAVEGRLYDTILKAVRFPFKPSEKASTKRNAVIGAMETLQSKLLFIDDISNLLPNTESMQEIFLGVLRTLMQDTEMCIVATGIPGARDVIRRDSQVENRFSEVIEIPFWPYDEKYNGLIAAFEDSFGFPKKSNFHAYGNAIWKKSRGLLGETRLLMQRCAFSAIDEKCDRMLKRHLDDVVKTPPPKETNHD